MDKSKPSKKRRRLNANSRRWQFAKQYFNSDLNLIWLNGNQQKKIKGKGVVKIRLDYDPVRKVYHTTNNVPIKVTKTTMFISKSQGAQKELLAFIFVNDKNDANRIKMEDGEMINYSIKEKDVLQIAEIYNNNNNNNNNTNNSNNNDNDDDDSDFIESGLSFSCGITAKDEIDSNDCSYGPFPLKEGKETLSKEEITKYQQGTVDAINTGMKIVGEYLNDKSKAVFSKAGILKNSPLVEKELCKQYSTTISKLEHCGLNYYYSATTYVDMQTKYHIEKDASTYSILVSSECDGEGTFHLKDICEFNFSSSSSNVIFYASSIIPSKQTIASNALLTPEGTWKTASSTTDLNNSINKKRVVTVGASISKKLRKHIFESIERKRDRNRDNVIRTVQLLKGIEASCDGGGIVSSSSTPSANISSSSSSLNYSRSVPLNSVGYNSNGNSSSSSSPRNVTKRKQFDNNNNNDVRHHDQKVFKQTKYDNNKWEDDNRSNSNNNNYYNHANSSQREWKQAKYNKWDDNNRGNNSKNNQQYNHANSSTHSWRRPTKSNSNNNNNNYNGPNNNFMVVNGKAFPLYGSHNDDPKRNDNNIWRGSSSSSRSRNSDIGWPLSS